MLNFYHSHMKKTRIKFLTPFFVVMVVSFSLTGQLQENNFLKATPDPQIEKMSQKALVKEATALYEAGEYRKAVPLLNKAIKKDPENFDLIGMRGVCYVWTAKTPLALKDLDLAIENAPKADYYFLRFGIREYSDVKGKENDISEAIKLDSTNPRYFYERGMLKINAMHEYLESKDQSEATSIATLEREFGINFNVCDDLRKAGELDKQYQSRATSYCDMFKNAIN